MDQQLADVAKFFHRIDDQNSPPGEDRAHHFVFACHGAGVSSCRIAPCAALSRMKQDNKLSHGASAGGESQEAARLTELLDNQCKHLRLHVCDEMFYHVFEMQRGFVSG